MERAKEMADDSKEMMPKHNAAKAQSARGSVSSRPQSYRFLQDELSRASSPLFEQSVSPTPPPTKRTLYEDATPTTTVPSSPSPGPDCAWPHHAFTFQRTWLMSDLERWRAAFQEEAHKSIVSLQQVLKGSDLERLGLQFFEERQSDAAQINQLREHIDSLLKLNARLRQTTLDMLTKEELGHFRRVMEANVETISQLLKRHEEAHVTDIHAVALEAAKQGISNITEEEAEMHAHLSNLWNQHASEIQSSRQKDSKAMQSLSTQMDSLHDRLQRMEQASQADRETAAVRFEKMVERVTSEILENFKTELKQAVGFERTALEKMQGKLSRSLEDCQTEFRWKISDTCKNLPQQVLDCVHSTITSDQTERMTRMESEVAGLRTRTTELQSELVESQNAKEELARSLKSPKEVVERIWDVERRGNVKFNNKTGELDILRGMEFVTPKPTEKPVAHLMNAKKVDQTITDILEFLHLFNVPVAIEAHIKGSESPFYAALTRNRAEYILEMLKQEGVASDRMVAKGLPGKQGRNQNCVAIKLDVLNDF